MRHFTVGVLSVFIMTMSAGMVGCETLRTPTGAGAATGAAAGAVIGGDIEGAAVGGVLGGATGYVIDRANP